MTDRQTNILTKPFIVKDKKIIYMYLYLHFLIVQAVFDSLFLILSNSIFTVSALIWPHQVLSEDYAECFMRIIRAIRDQLMSKKDPLSH